MRILLTGATGCLGQALVSELTGAGHEVIALLRSDHGLQGVETIVADLTRELPLNKLPGTVDTVLHAAQSRRFREFPDGAAEVFAINTAATFRLVEYARAAKAQSFVYTSTGSVYVPQPAPVDEASATAPASFYPASKLAAEALLAPYSSILAVSILRLFYVFGPGQTKMLVDGLADRISRGVVVTLQGEDGIRLAPTYSGDAASMIRTAAEQSWKGTYNAASPVIVSLKELAMEIGKAVGREPVFDRLQAPVPATPLPNVEKLSAIYDIAQLTPLGKALQRTFGEDAAQL